MVMKLNGEQKAYMTMNKKASQSRDAFNIL